MSLITVLIPGYIVSYDETTVSPPEIWFEILPVGVSEVQLVCMVLDAWGKAG